VVRQLQRRLGSLTQQVGENRPANESSSEERL